MCGFSCAVWRNCQAPSQDAQYFIRPDTGLLEDAHERKPCPVPASPSTDGLLTVELAVTIGSVAGLAGWHTVGAGSGNYLAINPISPPTLPAHAIETVTRRTSEPHPSVQNVLVS